MSSLHGVLNCCFLHLYLLFYGRGYRTVSILLLDWVMIIISYRLPTITISLSLSIWSQFAMQASTCCVSRNQEDISYRSPVIANLLQKNFKFRYMATGVGLRQISLTQLNSPTPKLPWLVQEPWAYLLYKPSYRKLCLITTIGYHGNKSWSAVSLNWPTKKTPGLVQTGCTYLQRYQSYSSSKLP